MHVISVLVVDYTYWLLFTRLVCLLHAVNSGVQFDLLDHCKLYTLMTINFFYFMQKYKHYTLFNFFYNNFLYKNGEAEINQNFNNVLRTGFLRLYLVLEIVITRAAPAFHKLFMIMGCVFDINTVYQTVEKLTFQAFY